jgi:hypothetical protein
MLSYNVRWKAWSSKFGKKSGTRITSYRSHIISMVSLALKLLEFMECKIHKDEQEMSDLISRASVCNGGLIGGLD